jgi:hypothetical protein
MSSRSHRTPVSGGGRSRRKGDQPESGPIEGDRLVDAQYVARLTGTGETQARSIMRALPPLRIARKFVRVRLADVVACLAAREIAPAVGLTR